MKFRPLGEIVMTFTAFLAVAVLAGSMPVDSSVLADLPSHFMGQYAVGAGLLLAAACFAKTPKALLALLVLLLGVSLFQIAPLLPFGADMPTGKTLKILQANVLFINKDATRFEKLIAVEKPDLIVTQETPPAFAKMFASLKKEYPYQNLHPDGKTPRGLAVLSKLPFEKMAMTSFDHPNVPAQQFTIRLAKQGITFLSIHPFTPTENITRRDNEFSLIAGRFSKNQPENFVLLGDFNATPYCQAYKKLVAALKLRNAREGHGILPTWPTFLPTPLLRIPIDHMLVSKNIAVADFRTGPAFGSDHLPVIAEISLRGTL